MTKLLAMLVFLSLPCYVYADDVRPKETPRDFWKAMGWDKHHCPQDYTNKWDIYEYLRDLVDAGGTIVIAHGVKAEPTDSMGWIPNTPPGRYLCYPTKDGPMMKRIK